MEKGKDDVTFCDLKERRHEMKGVTMVRDKESEAVSMNDPDVMKLLTKFVLLMREYQHCQVCDFPK